MKVIYRVYYKGPNSIAFRMYTFLKENPFLLVEHSDLSWIESSPVNTWHNSVLAVFIYFISKTFYSYPDIESPWDR